MTFPVERETGFEPATLALARRYSTTEPLAHLFHTTGILLPFCRIVNNFFQVPVLLAESLLPFNSIPPKHVSHPTDRTE